MAVDRFGIVHVCGEVDVSNVNDLRAAVRDAVNDSSEGLLIDLSDVCYMDSAGLAAIIAAYKQISMRGGKIALIVKNDTIRGLLDLIHLDMLPGLFILDDMNSARRILSN